MGRCWRPQRRSRACSAAPLSVSVLGVGAGLLLAATGAIEVVAEDDAVIYLVELALIVTLFSDGLLADRELLRVHWSPPCVPWCSRCR